VFNKLQIMHSVSAAANGLLATLRGRQIQMKPRLFDTEAHPHLGAGKSTFVRLLPIVGIGEGQGRKLNGHEYHNGPMSGGDDHHEFPITLPGSGQRKNAGRD
jgi:hypothetical protein